ncbi:MAG: tRNA (adenosine(37)-N6)-threonylcarbamoyltransferase complex ATPase subunit type 1 TsaE [Rhodospirillales bacterium 12-54-5]|nr:MAG: tRNA (adenosine(37)-N6)-threonylcarbamoyltransferase complex ATPase subunit type 1 TsaE [Rhodospirillales bacterium 12-54-5]
MPTLDDTAQLAKRLAATARPGDVFTLSGNLGAGKTAFARCFIQALSAEPVEVTSPTFTLLQTYPIPGGEIWHYDLYRIEHESALVELGLDDALAHITLIEWPERLGYYHLPIAAALEFRLNDDGSREVMIEERRV